MNCTYCKKQPAAAGKKKCETCFEKVRVITNLSRRQTKDRGICYRCGVNPLTTHTICDGCRIKHKADGDRRKDERVTKGICAECGKAPLSGNSRSCENCILKAMAKAHFKDVKKWNLLRQLFDSNSTCPYSGIKLILGINASLDHKVPKSKGGNNDTANLQFIHLWCNTIKSDMDESIFLLELQQFAEQVVQLRGNEKFKKFELKSLSGNSCLSKKAAPSSIPIRSSDFQFPRQECVTSSPNPKAY